MNLFFLSNEMAPKLKYALINLEVIKRITPQINRKTKQN